MEWKLKTDLSRPSIEEVVMHYASKYYDPVKAHAYYMRTRQLKGRPTSGMSDEQKEAWGYVKDQVTTENKALVDENTKQRDAQIASLRSEATKTRESIAEKLRGYIEKIQGTTTSKRDAITTDAKTKREAISERVAKEKEAVRDQKKKDLESLLEIPKTASAEQKERLRAQNASKKENINDSASDKLKAISDKASKERETAAANLKTAISNARVKAKEIKTALDAAKEDTLDKEYADIIAKIPSKSKKTK